MDSRGLTDPETEVKLLSSKAEPSRVRGTEGQQHQLLQSPAGLPRLGHLLLGFGFLDPISTSNLSRDEDSGIYGAAFWCQILI